MTVSAYLWVSVAIGCAQIVDCALVLTQKGRPSITAFAFAAIEYTWCAVSVYLLVNGASPVPNWLPASFVGYVTLCTAYGAIVVKRQKDGGDLVLTPKEVLVGGVFGIYFAVAALFCAALIAHSAP